ncbi:hypothetical protein WSM22_34050 [Cytophagales bacterium WSM2-2]|nr:hypothetical protein WSM22_34050 [Cytophagales bacterium WSM2-2]
MIRVFFISVCISSAAFGQVPALSTNGGTLGSNGLVKLFEPINEAHRDKTIDYTQVPGKYFWDDEWKPAVVVAKNGSRGKLENVKLNFYTNEVYFLGINKTELIGRKGALKAILFYSGKDTSNVTDAFEILTDAKGDAFYEILNKGKIVLMRKKVITLEVDNSPSALGKSEPKLNTWAEYCLKQGSRYQYFKNLNKNAITSVVTFTEDDEKWLSAKKNKLKKEEDVLEFLDFLNTKK